MYHYGEKYSTLYDQSHCTHLNPIKLTQSTSENTVYQGVHTEIEGWDEEHVRISDIDEELLRVGEEVAGRHTE